MRCPSCDHDNRAERRFCAECGAALTAPCAACGASNEPGEKFCGGCGERLSTAAQAPGAPTPTPEPEAALPAGERRQLTIVFCDLVGSTPLSQQLDAEECRDVIVQYQQAAAGAVIRFGGHVAKNLGDGLLIYFGWPTAREDDPERAVRAGLAIVDAMAQLDPSPGGGDGTRLAVRIGMHTGPVVIADGGEVFGETANVAARLQGVAAPNTVVMSAATQRLVVGIFIVEDLGPQALKGIAEPLACYRVVRPSGVRSRLDVAAGHLTRFVGREAEVGALLGRWEQVTEGNGQNVLVVGEAGVGKSRLAWELRQRLASESHTWLECRATPYTQGTPFLPVIELVEQGLAFAPDDTSADKIAKLERGLSFLREPLADTLPVVARLLGLPVPAEYPNTDLVPDMERQRTLEILSVWNLTLGEVQPLVLLVEDLHWCDPSSLQLLGRIIEQSATAHVLFIGTARPEFASPWPARSNTTTLQLARLTKRQAREMVHALGAALASETVEALVARADGVPLYLEELTKTVAAPGAARSADAIPATLADSLMARLDRLSTAKEVAQRAAVLGREFPYALLAAIAELDEAALRQGLARLVEAEIVFVRGEPPAATYTFKHALVQEAAYESLLKRARLQLHGRVCETLGQRATAEPEVLAHHAERAGRIDEAIAYLTRAGEQAQGRSGHAEAVRHFERAIGLLEEQSASAERDARDVELRMALVASLIPSHGYAHPTTRAVLEQAKSVAERSGANHAWRLARLGLAQFEWTTGQHARGRALAADVLGDGSEGAIAEIARIHVGSAEFFLSRFTSSLRHLGAAVNAYRDTQRRGLMRVFFGTDLLLHAYAWGAWNLAKLGQLDAAAGWAEASIAHAEQANDPYHLAFAFATAAVTANLCTNDDAARQYASRAIALTDRFAFPVWGGFSHIIRGSVRVKNGDPGGLAEIGDGVVRESQTGNRCGGTYVLFLVADAQHRLALSSDARATLDAARALSIETGECHTEAELRALDGLLALANGSPVPEVIARLRTALGVAREQGSLIGELNAAVAMARVLRDAGHRADARAELTPVYGKFTEGFGTPLLIEAKALLEELR